MLFVDNQAVLSCSPLYKLIQQKTGCYTFSFCQASSAILRYCWPLDYGYCGPQAKVVQAPSNIRLGICYLPLESLSPSLPSLLRLRPPVIRNQVYVTCQISSSLPIPPPPQLIEVPINIRLKFLPEVPPTSPMLRYLACSP